MNTFVKNNSLLITSKCVFYAVGSNNANWNRTANWNGTTGGNVTTVGTNGGPSVYGTYDQSGLVEEWLENYYSTISGVVNMYRHAASFDDSVSYLRYIDLFNTPIATTSVFRGFRICSYSNPNGYLNFTTVCTIYFSDE
jgi:formylglycine-generating enzyme required for sulfatase activity